MRNNIETNEVGLNYLQIKYRSACNLFDAERYNPNSEKPTVTIRNSHLDKFMAIPLAFLINKYLNYVFSSAI